MDAILAGGPEHGRRVSLGDQVKEYVTVAALPPLTVPAEMPPRPSWLARLLRWWVAPSRPPAPVLKPPSLRQASYRRDGQLADGTAVYWFREGLSRQPPAEGELYGFLLDALHALPPQDRMNARWVMGLDWYKKCRKLAAGHNPRGEKDETKWIPSSADTMLGKPMTVTDDGGVPHLEVSP